MKKILFFSLIIFLMGNNFSLASSKHLRNIPSTHSSSKDKIESEAGLNIPKWGIAIDAVYDERLDLLVPGYKLINLVVTNTSGKTIYLNPKRDRWRIVDHINQKHRAINHLKFDDKKAWEALPKELQEQLEYPKGVRNNHSVRIVLFFRDKVDLSYFREVYWRSYHLKEDFYIYMYTNENSVDAKKEIPIPETVKLNPPLTIEEIKREEELKRREGEEERNSSKPSYEFDPTLDSYSIPYD